MSTARPAGTDPFEARRILEDFVVRNDIALIRVAFFKERLRRSKEEDSEKPVPRRQEIDRHHIVHGVQLRGIWTDGPQSKHTVYAVSHAWMSKEHPDPGAQRLDALVDDLSWLGAVDTDLVFFDYCSLFQVKMTHPDYKEEEEEAQDDDVPPQADGMHLTPNQHKQHHTSQRYMDRLFSSRLVKVVVMPEIYDVSKFRNVTGKLLTVNEKRYIERGWCGMEFSAAGAAANIVAFARPLKAITTREESDAKVTEDMDFKELKVTVSAPGDLSGAYKMWGEFEGAPYFERSDGAMLMYRKFEERWFIGPTVGARGDDVVWAELDSGETEPPECYWKVKPMTHPDVYLTIMRPGISRLEARGFHYLRDRANGVYDMHEQEFHGRPYYVNAEGIYIYCFQQEMWYISPILGVMGDLAWAYTTNALQRPPDGLDCAWKVMPLICPDVKVGRPPSADIAEVSGFGWVRERGNGTFKITDHHDGGPVFSNPDGNVFIYRWREQRWRIATVLGAAGNHVSDETPCDSLEPPSGKWNKAQVEVVAEGSGDKVTLTGIRSTKIPGKMRFYTRLDEDEEWEEQCMVQEGFQDFPEPIIARFARFELEKDLAYLRCIKDTGVAYRNSKELEDRVDAYAGPLCGARVPVQTRTGSWIKAEKGWLPLWINGEKVFRCFPPADVEPYSCQIMGYRRDIVKAHPVAERPGIDASQFATLLEKRDAVAFSRADDKKIVLAMYRRHFGTDERKEQLRGVLRKGGKGAVRRIAAVRAAMQDPDGEVVKMAVEILAGLGAKLWPADIQGIADLLVHPDGYLREAAAHAVFKLGHAGAEPCSQGGVSRTAVAALLQDPDLDVRIAGAGALSALGPKAEASARNGALMLVEMLKHQDREVRRKSLRMLAIMGDFGSAHADEAAECLDDKVLEVRLSAVAALAAMGEPGAKHADLLVPLLADGYMRHGALAALTKMDRHPDAVAALLVSIEWYVRRDALLGLQSLGPPGVLHSEAIAAMLRDTHRDVRLAAINALIALGPSNIAQLAAALQAVAFDQAEEVDVRRAAQSAVEMIARSDAKN